MVSCFNGRWLTCCPQSQRMIGNDSTDKKGVTMKQTAFFSETTMRIINKIGVWQVIIIGIKRGTVIRQAAFFSETMMRIINQVGVWQVVIIGIKRSTVIRQGAFFMGERVRGWKRNRMLLDKKGQQESEDQKEECNGKMTFFVHNEECHVFSNHSIG